MSSLAHGIDLVSVSRIERMISDHGDRFLSRVFTKGERADSERIVRGRGERYAARFAAKEAILKALGTGMSGGITWQDIDVRKTSAGAPIVEFSGVASQKAIELGLCTWKLTLSHAAGLAIARVVACGRTDMDDS